MKIKPPALIIFYLLVLGYLFFLSNPALAAEYQSCETNSTCNIGEFLYDDSYAPIATASCTLTSRYPNGNLFLNSVSMAASGSGWYSYSTDSGTVTGVYPSQICCSVDTEYLCLDKTFRIQENSNLSASDVWSYSGRSLTSFGSLVTDIWGSSDRTLTSFGSVVSDVWNYSNRSLTGFGNLVGNIWNNDTRTLTSSSSAYTLVTINDIKEVKTVQTETRTLLEQLVNKPIVKTFIDTRQDNTLNLEAKITKTKSTAENLYSRVQNLRSRAELLYEKWPDLPEREIKSELQNLSNLFKEDVIQKDTNIISAANWLKTSWNNLIFLNLSDQAMASQSKIDNLLADLNLYGLPPQKSFTTALNHIQRTSDLVGNSLANAGDGNLYGFIRQVSDLLVTYNKQTAEGIKLLSEMKSDSNKDFSSAITLLSDQIISENQIPQAVSLFTKKPDEKNYSVNKILWLLGIIKTNIMLLAANTGETVNNVWLEEGSIVFRSIATNPSHTLTQKVNIKFYLPTEIKKEQIIKIDPELSLEFDPVENSLFASGEITLAPQESRTMAVETEDIWSFQTEEIDSLKNQVNEIVASLKNTSYYAQAVSLKSDIIVTLDKVMLKQSEATTPEKRIRTYRESSLEMAGVSEKILGLKELLIQANNNAGINGFIGGSQMLALWGLVIVVIAGFIFLTLYMKTLKLEALQVKKNQLELAEYPEPSSKLRYSHRDHSRPYHKTIRILAIGILTTGFGALAGSLIIRASRDGLSSSRQTPAQEITKYPLETNIRIPLSGYVPVRNSPSLISPQIFSIKEPAKILIFRKLDDWVQIGLVSDDKSKNWWTSKNYISSNI